jgi:hypothetical protein
MNRHSARPCLRVARTFALFAACGLPASAQLTPIPDPVAALSVSYETTQSFGIGPLPDQGVVSMSYHSPNFAFTNLGPLPSDADVDAFAVYSPTVSWFSLADWAELAGGVRAHPGDVMGWNGSNYYKVFDVMACLGVPGLNVDAIDVYPGLFGGEILVLSFDTSQLFLNGGNPFVLFDEQAITVNASICSFGAAPLSIPISDRRTDLHALSSVARWGFLLDREFYAAFDTWAQIDEFAIGPGVIAVWRGFGGQWNNPAWMPGFPERPEVPIDALWVLDAGLFADGVETANTSRWSETVP